MSFPHHHLQLRNKRLHAYKNIRKEMKLPAFNLHKVRRLWAQEQGASAFEASRMLGHSTPSTTEKHYTSISDERMRAIGNTVGEQLKEL